MEQKLSPELLDIIENIRRFCIANKDVHFVYGFTAMKDTPECKCPDCGGDTCASDETKTAFGAFGNLEILRDMSNDIRDLIEDNVDENGFVNL